MRGVKMTDTLKAQTIELYSKQLRTPMFNKYLDVIRQLDKNQGYEDFLIALMRVELDSRQESTRRRKIKSAGFPYLKTIDELDLSRFEHMDRSEEHTSELQSRPHLVCRLLLEKKELYNTPHAPKHF